MSEYILSCSSTVDLREEQLRERDIHYICFHFELDGKEYPDDLGKSIPFDKFYQSMLEGADTKTSQINADEFETYFEPFLKEGLDILHVTLSSGINGEQEVTADVTYIDGEKVGETRIGEPVVLREPVNAQVRVGTMPILTYLPSGGNSSESFMWPVKGGYVSAGLYGYYGHTGMDIAAPLGTEVRAAKDGQVIYATNYSIWPFGKSIDIDHGNGVRTKYAHCSAVFVTYGQYVRQGDLIGLVGRTGNATGNHLHLELWTSSSSSSRVNPVNYISRS